MICWIIQTLDNLFSRGNRSRTNIDWITGNFFLALEQGWRTYGTRAQSGTRLSLLFYCFFLYPTCISILWRICVYVYIYTHTHTHTHLTVYRLYMNYRCNEIIQRMKHFSQIGSGAKCWLDIYRLGPDLAVTWHSTERFTVFFVNRKY